MFGRNRYSIYPHAEINAILNAKRRGFEDWHNATLWIARVIIKNGQFQYALARPCEGCWRAIEHYGIKTVIWSIGESSNGVYSSKKR